MPDAPAEAMTRLQALRLRFAAVVGRLERSSQSLCAISSRTSGYILLLYAATVGWVALWAGYDVVILKGAFPSAPGYQANLELYWTATWRVLYPATALLAFRRHAWLPILALLLAGWEDILFFWVQGIPVPADTPWLAPTPTAALLYLRAVLFLAVSMVGIILARHPSVRLRHVPLPFVMLAAGLLGGFEIFVAVIPIYVATQKLLAHLECRHARIVGLKP